MSLPTITDEEQQEKQAVLDSQIAKKYALTGEIIYRGLASTIFLGVERGRLLQVGVKVLMKSRFDSEEEHKNAVREYTLHGSLPAHSNIIKLLAFEETPVAHILCTPYTPHGDLNELTRYGQTYCEAQTRHCAAQMLSALHHIHTVCGIVHTDIKPHNFLLFRVDGKHCVQLCDFGLAERLDPQTGKIAFRGMRGTSGWFSPEMINHLDYCQAVDIFGIGLILFRMLGGYHPFDPPSRFTHEIEFDDRCWCHIASTCREFLMKLLALAPADRGTATSLMEHDWIVNEPMEPDGEALKALSAYGPPPSTDILFWPADQIPEPHLRNSYADLSHFVQQAADMDVCPGEELPDDEEIID